MMHERDGEVDIRGAYCAVSVAKLTNVYTDRLFQSTAQWIAEVWAQLKLLEIFKTISYFNQYSFTNFKKIF